MFRQVLSAAVPKFNTKGEDRRLFVVFADFLGEKYINDEEKKRELENIIAGKIGRQVEVKFVLRADEHLAGGKLVKISVDDSLKKFVHMDIQIED